MSGPDAPAPPGPSGGGGSSDLARRGVRGAAWAAVESWTTQLAQAAVFIVLVNLLPIEAFGLLTLAQAILAIALLIPQHGPVDAIVQREILEDEHLDSALWASIAVALVLGAVALGVAGPLAAALGEPDLAAVLRWLAPTILVKAISAVPEAVLRRELRFGVLATRSLVATLVSGTVAVWMALDGAGVEALVAQVLVRELVAAIALWAARPLRPRLRCSRRHLADLLVIGRPATASAALSLVNRRADDLLIGAVLGTTALGYYGTAYGFIRQLTQVLNGVAASVALPVFSRLQRDPVRLLRSLREAMALTSAIAVPMFLGAAAVAPELVRVVFGERWAPSIPVLQVLALVGVLQAVTFYTGPLLTSLGRADLALRIRLLNAVLRVIGFVIAVRIGLVAVAAAYLVGGVLTQPMAIVLLGRMTGLRARTWLAPLLAPLSVGLAMMAAVGLWRAAAGGWLDHWPDSTILVSSVALGVVVYAAGLRLAAPGLVEGARRRLRLLRPGPAVARVDDGEQPPGT